MGRHRYTGPKPGQTQYQMQECVVALALVADLDPAAYESAEVKALIYKSRAARAKQGDTIYIHFT